MKSYGKIAAVLIALWFTFALASSAQHLFLNKSNRVGLAVGLAALAPIALFSLWFATSHGFRQFALTLNPCTLTVVQSSRIIGLTFVILQARGVLPAIFALPAGLGDMAIGATASFVAWKLANPRNRNAFILWQSLGIADLLIAVSLGITAPLLRPQGISTAAMTILPLSLIPTFLVPLYLIIHVICISQARSWRSVSRDTPTTATPVQQFATH
jgi:hypothetical protein